MFDAAVVINGPKRLSVADFSQLMGPLMGEGRTNVVAGVADNVMLGASVNDWTPDHVDVSWTYSRPARGEGDELHQPQRTFNEAREISPQFYDELNALGRLASPLKDIYNEEAAKEDRLFN